MPAQDVEVQGILGDLDLGHELPGSLPLLSYLFFIHAHNVQTSANASGSCDEATQFGELGLIIEGVR